MSHQDSCVVGIHKLFCIFLKLITDNNLLFAVDANNNFILKSYFKNGFQCSFCVDFFFLVLIGRLQTNFTNYSIRVHNCCAF